MNYEPADLARRALSKAPCRESRKPLGWQHGTNFLRRGGSFEDILVAFLTSNEFIDRFQNFPEGICG